MRKVEALDTPLPHNLDAESSILGAILLDQRAGNPSLRTAAARLKTEDFFRPADSTLPSAHQLIFSCMVAMAIESRAVDLVTLADWLRRSGHLEDAGGAAYLATLMDGMPRTSNIEQYIQIVKEKATLRTIIHGVAAIQQQAIDGDSAEIVIGRTKNLLDNLSLNGNGVALASYTARELIDLTPEPVEWIAYPLAARGLVTVLDGKAKTAGKTTLTFHAIRAVLEKRTFLNQATKYVNVLVISEENKTLALAIQRAGLASEDGLHIVPWLSQVGMPWSVLAERIKDKAREVRAGWLIVDTFFGVARLGLDKEKDAGAVDAAVAPMKTIAAELDVAVTLTRHERKSGGDIGDSGRGSSALTGACDIVLQLTRSASRPTMRQLEITGRIDPDKLTIELKDGTYISHGEFGEFRIAAAEKDEALDKAISDNPQATNEQLGRMVNISRNDIAARAAKLGWERAKGIGWRRKSEDLSLG